MILRAMSQAESMQLLELETIFANATVGIAFTRNRVFVRCNPAFEESLEYGPGELNGRSTDCLFASRAEYDGFAGMARDHLLGEKHFVGTANFRGKNGKAIICKVRASALTSTSEDEGTVWLFDDITADQIAAVALAQANAALHAVMINAPVGIIFTKDRQITRFNRRFQEMFRFGDTDPTGVPGRALFPSDAAYAEVGRIYAPQLSVGLPCTHELDMMRQDGETFWAELIAYVLDPQDASQGTIWLISDRSQERAQAQATQRALFDSQVLLDNVVVGILFLKNRVVQRCNPQAERILGFAPGTLVGQSSRVWYPNEAEFVAGVDVYQQLGRQVSASVERLHVRGDTGKPFWCRMTGHAFDAEHPVEGGSIWVLEDTSERHFAQAQLVAAKTLTDAVFNSANVSIISTNIDGVISLINDTALRWLGYAREELVGHSTPAVVHLASEVAQYAEQLSRELQQPVAVGFGAFVAKAALFGSDEREWTYVRRDGSTFPVHLSVSPMRAADGTVTGYIGVGIDVTYRQRADAAIRHANEQLERRVNERTEELARANAQLLSEIDERIKIEHEVRRMAHFDALTGLPNRNLLNDRIDQALEMARRKLLGVGILFIDLDHFKTINDTLGHHAGDQLLTQVAARMSLMLRSTDTLGRLGGDEFLLLVPNVEDVHSLEVLANKLVDALEPPFTIQSHVLHVTPSIGVACFPQHGPDRVTLMRNADTAMYFAKATGRNNFKFFADILNTEVDNRFQIANALRFGLSQNEFSLHYQPLMDDLGGEIFGIEALIRWNSHLLGAMLPRQFIAIAEESGLIISIGSWVLRQACTQARAWQQRTGKRFILTVNLSPQQFRQTDLVAMVRTILEQTQFPPECLELELTESSLMQDVNKVNATLRALVDLGLRLAIDDFGTGHSSLSHLRHFPVHTLKVDQSFVGDLGGDARAVGIVSTVLALGRTLGLKVIAEGVETAAQHRQLRELGCRYLQGYYFYRPMPAADIEALLVGPELPANP